MSQVLGPLSPRAPPSTTVKDRVVLSEIEITTLSDEKPTTGNDAKPAITTPSNIDLKATHLISSPYTNIENQLRLSDISQQYRLFAFALSTLKPIRPDYATAPYLESFNWPEVFTLLRSLCQQTGFQWTETSFYVVIFRSRLQENIDRERLGLLDQKSHGEACASGGLLKYWFGNCDRDRRNLATCLWRNHDDAVKGGGGLWHKQARAAARVMYETISFHTHTLTIGDNIESWKLEE